MDVFKTFAEFVGNPNLWKTNEYQWYFTQKVFFILLWV